MNIIIDKHYLEYARKTYPDIKFFEEIDQCPEAEALIGEPHNFKPEILDKMPNLRWIQSFRAGYDNIDMEYLKKRKITFTNGRDIFSVPIAEEVVLRILMHKPMPLNILIIRNNTSGKDLKEQSSGADHRYQRHGSLH